MKYGLIGKSLVHSYSREIHEALGQYTYELFSLTQDEMPEFVKARNFGGLNVTIPYKQDVMTLCDEVSELATAIGAVNTLYWKENTTENASKNPQAGRKLVGHNTDYEGFLYNAKRADIDFAGKTVLILGSGGTSLMARKAAADEGAAKVYVASRREGDMKSGTGETLANQPFDVKQHDNLSCPCNIIQAAAPVATLSYNALPDISPSIDIIINTTPVGTFPHNGESIISLGDFPNCSAVIDVIYNPFKTKLLLDAQKFGLKYANGLPMLVAQATAAAGYFLGKPEAFSYENERIIEKLTNQMQNIVLIGMPGSGKTTIGKILAEKTGKPFIDMDDEIIRKTGKSIPQIFNEVGENGFRDIESDVALELGKQRGLIIATGGGAVLRPKNADALRQNGLIIHIRRPADSLSIEGRPLSTDIDALRQMEKARMPIYMAVADKTFDNTSNLAGLHIDDIIGLKK